MKQIYLLATALTATLVFSQNRIAYPEQADLVEKQSTLTFGKDGIPLYFAVIKLNGKTLDVQPLPYLDGQSAEHIENFSGTRGYMLSKYMYFNLPKSAFTAEQIVELISTSKAKLNDDNTIFLKVRKGIKKYNEPDVQLPQFLTYTIETVSVK